MRKVIFLLFYGIIFFAVSVFSQEDDSANKYFKNQKIFLEDKSTVSLKSRPVKFSKKDYNAKFPKYKKRIYLKFKDSPSKLMLNKLKNQDITIKDHLSDSTYIVELDQAKLEFLKEMYFIAGFADIDPADKMSERLYKQEIPAYAKDGKYAKVTVSVYEDSTFMDATSAIRSLGGIVESKQFSRSHKLKVLIHPSNITDLAKLDFVKYIEEISPTAMPNNINAGKLSEVFWDNDGGTISGLFDQYYRENPPIPYGLTGQGVKVAVKDGGRIFAHHDLSGRLTIADDDNISSHATHVAGTIGAKLSINDNDGNTGGMAESVHIYSFSIYTPFTYPPSVDLDYVEDLYTALLEYDAPISNNSWGIVVGWGRYIRGYYLMWDWEDNTYLFGKYTSDTQDFDEFMYDYYDNNALVLKSAGNDREEKDSQNPPRHPHDGTLYESEDDYYDCIPPISCAKNIITVGSVGIEDNDSIISSFSSFGPTDDGRVKPDVVADGYELKSTWDNDGYKPDYSGTSMSCPVVTGISALIYEACNDTFGEYPTVDIVKALLCNYAHDLGKPGPDFSYGFGLVDAKACIDAIFNYDASSGGHIQKGVIGEVGDYLEFQFDIVEGENDNEAVKVTLAWIDPPGNPVLDNDTPQVVNDLDLYIKYNQNDGYSPFYFKEYDENSEVQIPADPTEPAKIGTNRYDTVEQVIIDLNNEGKIPPGTYRVCVDAYKIGLLNQPFAVVSTVGYRGFNFNTLKIRGAEEIWVSNQFAVLDKTPDVLLRVSELENEGFNPSTFEYKYATQIDNEGQPVWNSNWLAVSGVYSDEECTQQCISNPYYGDIAYVKVENVPFNKVSIYENRVKFRLTYKGEPLESPDYIVKNNNIYYVSDDDGRDDNDGKGTQLYPWKTIGHAIANCVATSTVPAYIRIQKDTYNENIALNNYVYLYGGYDSNWNRDVINNPTIIHGDGTTHTVVADNNAILDGLTIENGNHDLGGGIYSVYDNVLINSCIIQSCSAKRGGGIYIKGDSVILSDCIIKNSSAQLGGGAYFEDFTGIVTRCTFESNNAHSGNITYDAYHDYNYYGYGYGGGIFFVYSDLIIDNCYFKSNTSTSTYSYGAGIFTLRSPLSSIINSAFNSNSASGSGSKQQGGAIFCHDTSPIKIIGCLFQTNQSKQGSVLYCWSITMTNCTIYGNITNDNRTYLENISSAIHTNYGTHNICNCIFWSNTSNYGDRNYKGTKSEIVYSCIDDSTFTGTGTIHDNPQFKNPSSGDFRLTVNSPCIDYGNDNATGLDLLTEDIIGNNRKFKFDHNSSHTVDMGAYEYRWNFSAIEWDNSTGEVELEWESRDNDTYYVAYTDHNLTGTPSPVLHYKFNDNDNDSQVDESISSLHGFLFDNEGEINTGDYSNEGKINSAFHFHGNQYVDCGNIGNIGNISSSLSISVWLYLTGDSSEDRIIITKGSYDSYEFKVNETNRYFILTLKDTSETLTQYTSTFTCPTNQWVFITATVDFINDEVKFYLNDDLEDTLTLTNTDIKLTSSSLLISAHDIYSADPWIGYMDDIRIYNRVLNQEDIENLYNQGNGTEQINPMTWTRIQQAIDGEPTTTSWTDDGSQTSPSPDQLGLKHRFYKIISE